MSWYISHYFFFNIGAIDFNFSVLDQMQLHCQFLDSINKSYKNKLSKHMVLFSCLPCK